MGFSRFFIRIKIALLTIRKTIIYASIFFFAIYIIMIAVNMKVSFMNLVLFLSLNYEPKNELEALALFFTIMLELSPVMGFVELRTMSKEEKAKIIARSMKNHVIIIGAGDLGKKITQTLRMLKIDFSLVVLSRDKIQNEYVIRLLNEGFPVIFGNALLPNVLKDAGIEHAKTVIIAVNNDLLNARIAERIRELNPEAKIVARIYDDSLANLLLRTRTADEVISPMNTAVTSYIVGSFLNISTEVQNVITLEIDETSKLKDISINVIEAETGVKVLAIMRKDTWIQLTGELKIQPGDKVIVYGSAETFGRLIQKFA